MDVRPNADTREPLVSELRRPRHESFGELFGARAEYVWWKTDEWQSTLGYSFFTTYNNDIPKFNVIDHLGSLGVSRKVQLGEHPAVLGAQYTWDTLALDGKEFLTRHTGTASLMGCDINRDPEGVRRNLGFSSATTSLYPRLTARETIEFFARINGCPATQVGDRVQRLITRFGITEYADARVDKLSQGMKQKVSIARTIAHDPPILIFDEPTVGLDILNALEMQKVIAEFRNEGKTIIFSTHIMSEAEKLCDRIAIIHRGRIHACDTLANLRAATGQHYLEDIFVHFVRAS